MKRTAAVLFLLTLVSCGTTKNANILAPDVAIRQTVGPADVGATEGPIQVQFELNIANHSSEELRLQRVEIESVGTGAYVLRRETLYFKDVVAPLGEAAVRFWARGYARAGTYRAGVGEPVTIRAIVTFQSDLGPVRRILMKNIAQGQRSRED